MQKPTSIIIDEFKKEIVEIINNAELPLCIIESILKDLYSEVNILASQQLTKDKTAYEASLKEKETKG